MITPTLMPIERTASARFAARVTPKVESDDRTARRPADEDPIYDDGCLRVEHDNYYVTCKGEHVDLPRAEFLMFSRLARTPNRYVESEVIWRYAWNDRKPYNAESLHVIMYRLRRTFTPLGLQIDNKTNVGYRLSVGDCCLDSSTTGR